MAGAAASNSAMGMVARGCAALLLMLLVGHLAMLLLPPLPAAGTPEVLRGRASGGGGGGCDRDLGEYTGGALWDKPGETEGRHCLLQTPRVRVDYHARRLPDGELVGDWLWLEYGDRVNVLVQQADGDFVVFEQTKYALPGESLAVVGGFIEPGETPLDAAHREVLEELTLVCDAFEELGRYRTDVNRGLGWVNGFLATGCRHAAEGAPSDDQESQRLVRLDLPGLREAALAGRFVEVQWSNTVSLALLRLLRRDQR